jgi:hypothetical protein
MRERACLGDCIVGSLAIFALLAIIGHCRGCLPIITVVICDAQRVSWRKAHAVERSEAKRSEAERSGVSGVKADGLPVDLHGVGMALVALARAAIRAILLPTNGSTVERRRKHTTSSFYNDEENLLAFLAGCEHDARVMYHQATVFGVCTIYASGCEHDSRIMYHQASVDVCTIYASWHRFQSRRVSPGDSGWRLGAAREELQTRWPLLT